MKTRKILLPAAPASELKRPTEPPYLQETRDAVKRALSKPSVSERPRESNYWGFIYDDDITLALIYEYDEQSKPVKICPVPINQDIAIYRDEIIQSIDHLYGTEALSPVDMMDLNYNNFRNVMEYICDTDHWVELTLKVKHLGTGKEIVSTSKETPCYFFRTNDTLYDVWYDQYEELIEGFKNVRYGTQKAITEELEGELQDKLNSMMNLQDASSSPSIYGRTYFVETIHNPKQLNNKSHFIHVSLEVKL